MEKKKVITYFYLKPFAYLVFFLFIFLFLAINSYMSEADLARATLMTISGYGAVYYLDKTLESRNLKPKPTKG